MGMRSSALGDLEFVQPPHARDRAAFASDLDRLGEIEVPLVGLAAEEILTQGMHAAARAAHAVVPRFALQLVRRDRDCKSHVILDIPQWARHRYLPQPEFLSFRRR